eukprot:GHVQ01000178.1.p1 GENE.GHVQ01000178.1~~GHVQ01000178.1.p1  ORF type:complete len:426 (+),score=85.22 GHVQ01000178.1:374-1651(+)
MSSTLQNSKRQQGHDHLRRAQQSLKTNFFLLKFSPDYDIAALEYSQAAQCFTACQDFALAVDSYTRVARIREAQGDSFGAGRAWEGAGSGLLQKVTGDDSKGGWGNKVGGRLLPGVSGPGGGDGKGLGTGEGVGAGGGGCGEGIGGYGDVVRYWENAVERYKDAGKVDTACRLLQKVIELHLNHDTAINTASVSPTLRNSGSSNSSRKAPSSPAGVGHGGSDVYSFGDDPLPPSILAAEKCYEKCLDLYSTETKPHYESDIYKQYISFLCEHKQWHHALHVFNRHIKILRALNQHNSLFKAVLCKLIIYIHLQDLNAADRSLSDNVDAVDSGFMASREFEAGIDLVEAFRERDTEKMESVLSMQIWKLLPVVEVARLAREVGGLVQRKSLGGGAGNVGGGHGGEEGDIEEEEGGGGAGDLSDLLC